MGIAAVESLLEKLGNIDEVFDLKTGSIGYKNHQRCLGAGCGVGSWRFLSL